MIVTAAALRAALHLTRAAVPGRPAMPIMAGVRMIGTEAGLECATFDLETSIRTVAPAQMSEPFGPVVLSHRLLASIADVAKADLTLEVDPEQSLVVATAGRSRWTLPRMPVEDFPILPALSPVAGKLEAEDFLAGLAAVLPAVAKGDERPALTGVRFTFGPDMLDLAATDSYRAHTASVPWQPTDTIPDPVLIPAPAVRAMIAPPMSGPVELRISPTMAGLSVGATETHTRLLDAAFPAVERLFRHRDDSAIHVVVEKSALATAVAEVGPTLPAHHILQMRVTETGLQLTAIGDSGASSTADIDAQTVGDIPAVLGFNAAYLADAVSAVPGDMVEMGLRGRQSVMLGQPDGDCTLAVMPIVLPDTQ